MKTVARGELIPGDHIFSDRKLEIYFHHGIYVGYDTVIHMLGPSKTYSMRPCQKCGFTPRVGIVKTCLDCFLDGNCLYRCDYDVNPVKWLFKRRGSCNYKDCASDADVVRTAYRLLQEQNFGSGEYNFFFNNCENFAVYCKTGKSRSLQAAGLFGFSLLGGHVAYKVTKGFYDITHQ